MQVSHMGSEEKLGKIKKSWGKLREVMGQFLHLIQEDAIGFNSLRSRFHCARKWASLTSEAASIFRGFSIDQPSTVNKNWVTERTKTLRKMS